MIKLQILFRIFDMVSSKYMFLFCLYDPGESYVLPLAMESCTIVPSRWRDG